MADDREPNIRVKISIPASAKEKLEQLAEDNHESFSSLCREILLQYLQNDSTS